jgi:hypothetical protein
MLEVEESRQQYQKQVSLETGAEDLPVEENSRLSEYHKGKLFIGFLKILPMVLAGLFLTNTILSYFYIDYEVISYLAGIGFIPWLFIMMASYRLHFCEYHRMFLWYILANNGICWVDSQFTLPIDNWNYFILHIIMAGVFLFLVLYFHQKCRKHKN